MLMVSPRFLTNAYTIPDNKEIVQQQTERDFTKQGLKMLALSSGSYSLKQLISRQF
jgi:hypothetical protein